MDSVGCLVFLDQLLADLCDVSRSSSQMSVGFGFSAGDFIVALELVETVIRALEDSGIVSIEYCELLGELRSFETALIRVKQLELNDT